MNILLEKTLLIIIFDDKINFNINQKISRQIRGNENHSKIRYLNSEIINNFKNQNNFNFINNDNENDNNEHNNDNLNNVINFEENNNGNNNIENGLENYLEEIDLTKQIIDKAETKECPICLIDYNIGDKICYLSCFHFFHSLCIKNWTKNQKDAHYAILILYLINWFLQSIDYNLYYKSNKFNFGFSHNNLNYYLEDYGNLKISLLIINVI